MHLFMLECLEVMWVVSIYFSMTPPGSKALSGAGPSLEMRHARYTALRAGRQSSVPHV